MRRAASYKFYWRVAPKLAPGIKDSQNVYEEVLSRRVPQATRWLDLGCGHHVLPTWRFEREQELVKSSPMVVGLDYDQLSLTKHRTITNRVRGSISKLPFADASFDLVTSNMVFEHLDNPVVQLQEVHRVLRKGGRLVFHTPNKYGYATWLARMVPENLKDRFVYFFQGRKEEDVFPAYYRINAPSQIGALAEKAGFRVVEIQSLVSTAQFIAIPPLVVLELLWIRFLMSRAARSIRPYLIVSLEKTA